MRNRPLHDALRDFALEAAALLLNDHDSGAELRFDVAEEPGRGPTLYRYRPLTDEFIAERWQALRELPGCAHAARELGDGAAAYLRVSGLSGAEAEPALRAMLERLYEDATSFAFPEERFERVYGELERTLYRDSAPATVICPMPGLVLQRKEVELGSGLSLVDGQGLDAPPEAVWGELGGPERPERGRPTALCRLECDIAPEAPLPLEGARTRFRRLLTGLRLFKAGGVALGAVGYARAGHGRWQPAEVGTGGAVRGDPWALAPDEEDELRELLATIARSSPAGAVAWALARFEMGCGRALDSEALSDHLLALRALLDAGDELGRASLSLRLAALCAHEGERRAVQRRVELAFALERFVIGGGEDQPYVAAVGSESPRAIVEDLEAHVRALLRDVLCGYLEPELRRVADDILLDAPEPPEIRARDLRERPAQESHSSPRESGVPPREPHFTPAEPDASSPQTEPFPSLDRGGLEEEGQQEEEASPGGGDHADEEDGGVTPSADWALDEDPESYSAPV